jgi:hypothetical protein
MLISTNRDANAALEQLSDDIGTTAQQLAAAAVGIDAQDNLPGTAGAFSSILNAGSDATVTSAGELLLQVEQLVTTANGAFDNSDTPITADQIAILQNVQQTVIDARQAVNSTISAVSWTFGDVASDAANTLKNLGSRAIGAIVDATGINWLYVKIGGGLAAAVVLYAVYRRVSGR